MSGAEPKPQPQPVASPDQEQPPAAPAPFTMLGASGVGVCEGDVCAMPDAAAAPITPATAVTAE